METFDVTIRCTLKDLYDCNGVDGFNDLIEARLGHGITDASWELAGTQGDYVLVRVTGQVFDYETEGAPV